MPMQIIHVGGRIVNAYLYPADDGYVLVDTGYSGGFPRFLRRLRRAGVEVEAISWVFLTHAHDDHAGFLNDVLHAAPNAKVVLHGAALPGLRRGQNSFEGGCSGRLALGFCRFMKFLGRGEHRFPSLASGLEGRIIAVTKENQSALEKALRGKILETPGHTADSISLLLPDGSLFCGDAAMNGFPSRHKITIWVEDKADFCATWEVIIRLRPERVYPGHGRPMSWRALARNLRHAKQMRLRPLSP